MDWFFEKLIAINKTNLKAELSPSRKLCFIDFNENPLKMMKTSFISSWKLFLFSTYRKILLTRPGRVYGQRKSLMALYSGWGRRCLIYGGGGLIFGRKNASICNLLNLFFFLFSCTKHVFWHLSHRVICEICWNQFRQSFHLWRTTILLIMLWNFGMF